MTYQEQLLSSEWTAKRLEILERDGFKCVDCHTARPQFNGIVKSFGILNFVEMRAKGYQLLNPANSKLHYDNLQFLKDSWLNPVTYIGDIKKVFNIDELFFAKKCNNVKVFGLIKAACGLICFYRETIAGQVLIDLNVHHEYYIQGHKAWEYDNSVLVSLCVDCHKKRHEASRYYVYSEDGDKLMFVETCDRCMGAGFLKEYDYYMSGVCFQCSGEGVIGIK